jgi:SagB-type dehydrogenase family enzyme
MPVVPFDPNVNGAAPKTQGTIVMKHNAPDNSDRLQPVFEYHQATKHRFDAYAPGPGFLDWTTQPNPFRRYAGARLIPLGIIAPTDEPRYDAIFIPGSSPPCAPLTARSISQLFYDSLALAAWKSIGDSRWALRVNASSGNLHPTEGYLICGPVEGLCEHAMICHYAPEVHALEVVAEFDAALWDALRGDFPRHAVFIGLTSIHWREAWKYGQRAYRYCMHDAGHAIGAISIAAAGLGWRTRLLDELGADDLALLMGTFRPHESEREEPDVLMACTPMQDALPAGDLPATPLASFAALPWQGSPNRLSPSHVEWGIEELVECVRKPRAAVRYEPLQPPPAGWPREPRPLSLRRIIRQRRSAVAMDGQTRIGRESFYRMLHRTLAVPGAVPFSTLPWKSRIHLAIFVHRVDDLPRGLYLLVRDPAQATAMQEALTQADPWRRPPECPRQLPLYCLIEADAREAARQIACHQAIASDGCFSLAMLAEFTAPLEHYGPWFYPRLYWEAGVIGQLLYLEAEAAGLRATGIGCYFDDPMHEVLGLAGSAFQDLYHFTVGGPIDDERLTTLPAYAGR